MRLVESFASIQGESTYAGRPCFFLRLAGCNLACSYCDTLYAQSPGDGREIGVEEALALAAAAKLPLVEVTGGEPLCTPETPELCRGLLKLGMEVLVETNGSLDIGVLPSGVVRIVDVKMPSSGMFSRNLLSNLDKLTSLDEVKFVIGSSEDYECAKAILRAHNLAARTEKLLFSPVWGAVDLRKFAERIVADRLPVRLGLQLHKIVWPPDLRGV